MVWLKIDDKFHGHPKIVMVGNAAAGLFVRLASYCSEHGTDGVIPLALVRAYGTRGELAALLRGVDPLLVDHPDGYLIPDFLDYNPSAVEVEAKRQARSEAGRLGGKASGATRRSKREANHEANASANGEANVKQNRTPVPVPVPSTSSSTHDSPSSVSQGTDDDSYQQVISMIVDAKERAWSGRIGNPRSWRHRVHMNTHLEDGDQIRSELALGNDLEHVALTVLGYGHDAARERMEEHWCASDCAHGCEGDGWTRTDEGFAPCPGRC